MKKQSVAQRSRRVDILLGQLKQLNKEERVLMGLYFYEQLSLEEIAFVLGKSEEEVQAQLEQILPRLILKPEETSSFEPIVFEISG